MQQRVIVISGASRGIGRAAALALAAPGTTLVLGARSRGDLDTLAGMIEAAGGAALAVPCDVRDEAQVAALCQQAAGVTGQIDALVNAAGFAVVAPFEEIALDAWRGMLDVGLTGTFLVCKHALPYLVAGSSILNIGSVAARQAFPHWSGYCATKAGLLAFTNALREEMRPRGVRVVSLLPAATDTAIWDAVPGQWNRANMLHPDDIARTIAWVLAQPSEVMIEELAVGHVVGRL